MDNLQTEVLELEFAEFSCGLQTISEIEFAQILLRYTKLTKEENDRYLNRLRSRIEHSKVTIDDWYYFLFVIIVIIAIVTINAVYT